jgi:hypothetical protein
MENLSEKKILVIGSLNHEPLADRCVSWHYCDSVYLGDYHLIIINLQDFPEYELENSDFLIKMEKIREQINEIIYANTEIICITAPTISKNCPPFPNTISNYHWCPIYLNFVKANGESFEEESREGYLKFLDKWTHYLESASLKFYKLQHREKIDIIKEDILKNLARKPLAFKIIFFEFDLDTYGKRINHFFSRPLLFLPPPTKISVEEAIKFLLQQERGLATIKETTLPKWAEEILIWSESEIKIEIKNLETLKKKCEKELEEYHSKLKNLIKFKRLLTADGEELEGIVEESLKLLGIEVKSGSKGKEDRIVIDPETKSEVPIEITGKKYSIPESKLNQLIGRLSDEKRINNIKCKCHGILIGNHYKDEPLNTNLQGRKRPFEPDVVKKAETSKICLLSTIELFKAVNAKLSGNDVKDFVKLIFNKPGEVIF